jgi:hypothetical protein
MPGQETCAPPVSVPAQINAATAERAAEQISAALTPGVTVVIADLTATACRDCSAIGACSGPTAKPPPRRTGAIGDPARRPAAPDHRIRRHPPTKKASGAVALALGVSLAAAAGLPGSCVCFT